MWPNIEIEVTMSKLDAIRDIMRIAYGSEGVTRSRLFAAARDMLGELHALIEEEAPASEEDEE